MLYGSESTRYALRVLRPAGHNPRSYVNADTHSDEGASWPPPEREVPAYQDTAAAAGCPSPSEGTSRAAKPRSSPMMTAGMVSRRTGHEMNTSSAVPSPHGFRAWIQIVFARTDARELRLRMQSKYLIGHSTQPAMA